MIRRLICWWKGHKRGVRIDRTSVAANAVRLTYQCPRCKAKWERREKVA